METARKYQCRLLQADRRSQIDSQSRLSSTCGCIRCEHLHAAKPTHMAKSSASIELWEHFSYLYVSAPSTLYILIYLDYSVNKPLSLNFFKLFSFTKFSDSSPIFLLELDRNELRSYLWWAVPACRWSADRASACRRPSSCTWSDNSGCRRSRPEGTSDPRVDTEEHLKRKKKDLFCWI